jgi:hypothetical protein
MAYSLPKFPIDVAVWFFGSDPETDPPDDFVLGNLCFGPRGYPGDRNLVPFDPTMLPNGYLLFPKEYTLRGDIDTGGTPDTLRIPADTGTLWLIHWQHVVAPGFDNEHKRAIVIPIPDSVPPPPGEGYITEDSQPLVTETGDRLIPE